MGCFRQQTDLLENREEITSNHLVEQLANQTPLKWIQYMDMDKDEAMGMLTEDFEKHLIELCEGVKKAAGFIPEGIVFPSERLLLKDCISEADRARMEQLA